MITLLGLGLILELGLVLELGLDLGRMIPGACIAFAAALTFMLIFLHSGLNCDNQRE